MFRSGSSKMWSVMASRSIRRKSFSSRLHSSAKALKDFFSLGASFSAIRYFVIKLRERVRLNYKLLARLSCVYDRKRRGKWTRNIGETVH